MPAPSPDLPAPSADPADTAWPDGRGKAVARPRLGVEPEAAGGGGVVRVAAGLVVAALVITGLYFGRGILIPLALAILLGFVLGPAVTRLRRWGLPRLVAVLVVVGAALSIIGGSAMFMAWEVRALSAQLPTYQTTIKDKLDALREALRAPGVFDGLSNTVSMVQREVERLATPADSARPGVQQVELREPAASPVRQALAWVERAAGPLVDAGIVLVFVFMVLLDRLDLRDRLIRLMGGNLHRATDAMDEAGDRISNYLIMQLWINLSYGIPMAAGLWLIGIPGAFLWGMLAAVMRYVPYVGPLISAAFPLTLAFAVDPGWSLLLWTLTLILTLELISNNIVEPWLYGSSTGLSAISLIVAATFWTALWGPVGLIMSTPLTVCLLVIGRYLPALQFLDVLLGSQPALDAPTRLYQRLLGGDPDEAIELGRELSAQKGSVARFYDEVGIPVLRMAVADYQNVSTSEHRLRLITGMDALLDELGEEAAPRLRTGGRASGATAGRGAGGEVARAAPASHPLVFCLGGRWEVDTLAARMLAQSLDEAGLAARHELLPAAQFEALMRLDLSRAEAICLSWFAADPRSAARRVCRRLRQRWPRLRIVLCTWSLPDEPPEAAGALGADAIAATLTEAVMRTQELLRSAPLAWEPAPIPEGDVERVRLLRASGVLDRPDLAQLFEQTAKRAAAIFDMPAAMVSFIDEREQQVRGFFGGLEAEAEGCELPVRTGRDELQLPRSHTMCGHVVARDEVLVVPDIWRDSRFAGNPVLRARGLRFYAGAPLRARRGGSIGALCLLDTQPRHLSARDLTLLQAMADDLMETIAQTTGHAEALPLPPAPEPASEERPTATVGQVLPGT